MKLKVKDIGVDSGTILLSDDKYYDKYERRNENLHTILDVENGTYNCKWRIRKTWNGNVSGEGILIIWSGKLVVPDPCYIIGEKDWHPLLDKTDYFRNPEEGTIILDKMGGDGCYNIELDLKKIDEVRR
jgi:hypothetical protein